jgi:hypothetical protein
MRFLHGRIALVWETSLSGTAIRLREEALAHRHGVGRSGIR